MVPTQSGFIEIPQITIPWWNITTDQLEATVIPATRLSIASVEGDVPAEQTVASTEDLEQLLAAAPVVDQDMIDAQAEAQFIEVDARWLNYGIVLAFLIVAFSIYRLVLSNYREEVSAALHSIRQQIADKYSPEKNESVAFNRLSRACRTSDVTVIRETLIQWCDHFISERPVRSMEDILQQQSAIELHDPARKIQSELFNPLDKKKGRETFNPKQLMKLVSSLRKHKLQSRKQLKREALYALPPLYKS